ncbi:MAG: type I-E CRISPR-associated protein Cas7/Cse4/CasC [Xanthomonadales bacterium]|nr:type I-E CRISPR-associated protein Cas7/Cse4/CasC [Xanthomonadales bacterium]
MNNTLTNTRVEFHILQSFPVTCLNRDDVGAPKTAVVGGVTRARVSSQCWKRQVRLALHDCGLPMGTRTKRLGDLVAIECERLGANEEQRAKCQEAVNAVFAKPIKKGKDSVDTEESDDSRDEKVDTLMFVTPAEMALLASKLAEKQFDPEALGLPVRRTDKKKEREKRAKVLAELIARTDRHVDALDVALFGRMVAQAVTMNVEAAASFAHAISTHRVSNEVEFFTALDDLQEGPGSAHMGSLEFNSATYYRYVSLDLGQLAQTLGTDDLKNAVAAFTKALFVAVPNARQTTMSGAGNWDFARVLVRTGQRLQLSFDEPVKARGEGYAKPSIERLKADLDKKEKLTGSLFGKLGSYDWGVHEDYSIDNLVSDLQSHIQ